MNKMSSPKSPFPGVPLVESPVFGAEIERMELTPEERKIALALNRDGFAVLDFPDPDIDMRINRIRRELAPRFGFDDNDPECIKLGCLSRIQDAWASHPDVQAIAANPTVIDLLSRLYGRHAFPFQTLNFPVGTQQHLHTDSVHFSSIPPKFMCGVWLAMEDVQADAGPLCYVPGSHKWPSLDNCMIARRGTGVEVESAQAPFEDAWAALIAEHQAKTQQFLARKGQALIWAANLLHGGSVQNNPKLTRWSQVTHYYFDDCVYYTPALSDEYLGSLALRNLVSIVDGAPKPNLYLGDEILPKTPLRKPREPLPMYWARSLVRTLKLAKAQPVRRVTS